MPELPDVETFRKYLDSTALHKKITNVKAPQTRVLKRISGKKLKSALKGRTLESSDRRGKWMFVHLDDGKVLVLHFGMTGFLKYFKDMKDDSGHDRLMLTFDNGYHLAYDSQRMFGEVHLIDDVEEFISDRDLGPDALNDVPDFKSFQEIFGNARGMAKTVLMNQSNVAGIGNIYSDEILFQSGIHPEAEISKLDEKKLKKLYRVMKRVLSKAVEKNAEVNDLPQTWIIPHRNDGDKCPGKCGGEVKKITVGGRSAYYCPKCQKK
jgi:formamidopyrimidine-DNA glycosylase